MHAAEASAAAFAQHSTPALSPHRKGIEPNQGADALVGDSDCVAAGDASEGENVGGDPRGGNVGDAEVESDGVRSWVCLGVWD